MTGSAPNGTKAVADLCIHDMCITQRFSETFDGYIVLGYR